MNSIQLSSVDLNLLVVLDALLRERSVRQAAAQLNVTPSAVSHALKRLRDLLGDELLIRDGRRMRPTVRAEALAETLPRLLQQIALAIEPPEVFDSATSQRTFRLAAPDFLAPLVPTLFRRVHAEAPGVRIELVPFNSSASQSLAEGRYDAMVAATAAARDDLRSTPVGSWPWIVYGRAGHPAFDDWSVKAWSQVPHLQVRPPVFKGPGPSDRRAAELGIPRMVQAEVPHFSMAAPIIAETDLLLTVPSVTMTNTAAAYSLDHREVPFDLAPLEISVFRSAVQGDEPAVRWFLDHVQAMFDGNMMDRTV